MSDHLNIPEATPADRWAVVEIMGHRRLVGRVTEVTQFGCVGIRVDVPGLGDRCPECKGYGQVFMNATPGGGRPSLNCKPCLSTGKRRDGVREPDWVATQFYAGTAIFAVTPITEEAARRQAQPKGRDASLTVLDYPFAPPRRELPGGFDEDNRG